MEKLILAQGGKALLPIELPQDAPQALNTAAEELQHWLTRVTGAKFAVKAEDGACAIHLAEDGTLAEEAFRLKTEEGGLFITGGSPRGTLYGAYGFLEDVLGLRFYTPDVTKVPKQTTLALEPLDRTDAPALEFRQLDNPRALIPEWHARNRINGPGNSRLRRDETQRFGGVKKYALFVHTFNTLVPPEQYMQAHPEYYSMVDGVRISERAQLCLTNPEVLAIATETVRETLRKNPDAAIISVSQNDWYNPCTCPACAKVDAEEGSHAGTLIRFVNAIAEAIEPEFPQVVVDTLAYQYTRTPPKLTKPRANVCVRLCSIECCFAHPLETCDVIPLEYFRSKAEGPSFREDFIGWGKICKRVYIWDYVTDYTCYWQPFPNFQVLGPNMRFFVENGVRGVYEEGTHNTISPELVELRSWLLAKLLWNPYFDVEAGIREFTDEVFGPAAPEIRAYIELFQKHLEETGAHMCIYELPTADYLKGDVIEKARELTRKALAKELTLIQRLYTEKVDLCLEFVEAGREALAGKLNVERMDAMLDKASALNITEISEGISWNQMVANMVGGDLMRRG